jgi:predicted TIM-barrel fold metal-dependent hydrolase
MNNLPYKGIKLHPQAHKFNYDDMQFVSVLHELFNYAQDHTLPVLLHTGYDTTKDTEILSHFFAEYPNVKVILAHCRPLKQTIALMKKYANVCCDTAFVPEADIRKIMQKGLASKIIPGSDFPITHYYAIKYPRKGQPSGISLEAQYQKDIGQMFFLLRK